MHYGRDSVTRIADLAFFKHAPRRPKPSARPAPVVLSCSLEAGARLARSSNHRIARVVEGYQPRGVLLRWRHCWWDLNGFFVQPVGKAQGGRRVFALAPRAVLQTLAPDQLAKIAKARRAFHAALDRVLGRDDSPERS